MDFTSASTLVIQNITALGDEALVVFGAVILVAAGVFLIRWGFSKAKGALDGTIEEYKFNYYGDDLEKEAYNRGKRKFKSEGFTFND